MTVPAVIVLVPVALWIIGRSLVNGCTQETHDRALQSGRQTKRRKSRHRVNPRGASSVGSIGFRETTTWVDEDNGSVCHHHGRPYSRNHHHRHEGHSCFSGGGDHQQHNHHTAHHTVGSWYGGGGHGHFDGGHHCDGGSGGHH